MKKLFAAVLMGAVFGLNGCSIISCTTAPKDKVTGVKILDEQMVGLKDRYSTTLAVSNRLGPPSRKLPTASGGEQWFYDYLHTFRAHPEQDVSESMVFDFGHDGIMTAHKRVVPMAR